MPTPENIALARTTLDYIKEHPQEWEQDSWRCDSAACFAGHAAILSGKWVWNSDSPYDETVRAVSPGGTPYGEPVEVWSAAQVELGLTYNDSEALFEGENTLSDLEELVGAIEKPSFKSGDLHEISQLRDLFGPDCAVVLGSPDA